MGEYSKSIKDFIFASVNGFLLVLTRNDGAGQKTALLMPIISWIRCSNPHKKYKKPLGIKNTLGRKPPAFRSVSTITFPDQFSATKIKRSPSILESINLIHKGDDILDIDKGIISELVHHLKPFLCR